MTKQVTMPRPLIMVTQVTTQVTMPFSTRFCCSSLNPDCWLMLMCLDSTNVMELILQVTPATHVALVPWIGLSLMDQPPTPFVTFASPVVSFNHVSLPLYIRTSPPRSLSGIKVSVTSTPKGADGRPLPTPTSARARKPSMSRLTTAFPSTSTPLVVPLSTNGSNTAALWQLRDGQRFWVGIALGVTGASTLVLHTNNDEDQSSQMDADDAPIFWSRAFALDLRTAATENGQHCPFDILATGDSMSIGSERVDNKTNEVVAPRLHQLVLSIFVPRTSPAVTTPSTPSTSSSSNGSTSAPTTSQATTTTTVATTGALIGPVTVSLVVRQRFVVHNRSGLPLWIQHINAIPQHHQHGSMMAAVDGGQMVRAGDTLPLGGWTLTGRSDYDAKRIDTFGPALSVALGSLTTMNMDPDWQPSSEFRVGASGRWLMNIHHRLRSLNRLLACSIAHHLGSTLIVITREAQPPLMVINATRWPLRLRQHTIRPSSGDEEEYSDDSVMVDGDTGETSDTPSNNELPEAVVGIGEATEMELRSVRPTQPDIAPPKPPFPTTPISPVIIGATPPTPTAAAASTTTTSSEAKPLSLSKSNGDRIFEHRALREWMTLRFDHTSWSLPLLLHSGFTQLPLPHATEPLTSPMPSPNLTPSNAMVSSSPLLPSNVITVGTPAMLPPSALSVINDKRSTANVSSTTSTITTPTSKVAPAMSSTAALLQVDVSVRRGCLVVLIEEVADASLSSTTLSESKSRVSTSTPSSVSSSRGVVPSSLNAVAPTVSSQTVSITPLLTIYQIRCHLERLSVCVLDEDNSVIPSQPVVSSSQQQQQQRRDRSMRVTTHGAHGRGEEIIHFVIHDLVMALSQSPGRAASIAATPAPISSSPALTAASASTNTRTASTTVGGTTNIDAMRVAFERHTIMHLTAQSFHLDSQLPSCEFPVVLLSPDAPFTAAGAAVRRDRPRPALDAMLILSTFAPTALPSCFPSAKRIGSGGFTSVFDVADIRLVSLHLQPIAVNVEDALIFRMVHFALPLVRELLPSAQRASTISSSSWPLLPSSTTSPLTLVDRTTRVLVDRLAVARLFMHQVVLSDIAFRLTAHAAVAAPVFLGAEQMPVSLSAVSLQSVHCSAERLVHELAANYLADAIVRSPLLLGSLDLLGNPTFLVHSLGKGMHDLVYLPSSAVSRGPAAFVRAIGGGLASLARHAAEGTLTSVSGFSRSLARNVERLSPADLYSLQRELTRRDRGAQIGLGSGLYRGIRTLSQSVAGAVVGVAAAPIRGASRGGVRGFVGGMGAGLLGVVTKPLSGMLDLVSQASTGLANTSGLGLMDQRRAHFVRDRMAWSSSLVSVTSVCTRRRLRRWVATRSSTINEHVLAIALVVVLPSYHGAWTKLKKETASVAASLSSTDSKGSSAGFAMPLQPVAGAAVLIITNHAMHLITGGADELNASWPLPINSPTTPSTSSSSASPTSSPQWHVSHTEVPHPAASVHHINVARVVDEVGVAVNDLITSDPPLHEHMFGMKRRNTDTTARSTPSSWSDTLSASSTVEMLHVHATAASSTSPLTVVPSHQRLMECSMLINRDARIDFLTIYHQLLRRQQHS
jgi:hypothetical protein